MYNTYLELIKSLTHTQNNRLYFHSEEYDSTELDVFKKICFTCLIRFESSLADKDELLNSFYKKQIKQMYHYKHRSIHKSFSYICLDKLYEEMILLIVLHQDEVSPYLAY